MLQEFFESLQGQILLILLIAGTLALIFFLSKKDKKYNVKALTYSSIAVALGFVLNQVTLFRMPQGGSITPFSMLFIVIIGYFFGARQGILAGVAFGLLDLLVNPYIVHPMQLFLDYPLAFGALGISGLFRSKHIVFGYLVGVFGRLVCHVISGVIFFAAYTPAGTSVFMYSLGYNGSFLGIEALLTCILLFLPPIKSGLERVKNAI
ncbi:energy-coupled thiamine transporter ThiT [Alkalibaculum sp. M08DMB]|uniref:Energy-coupled thiamine transporter ThiT n=1 Tax=Alkalibaculum sporogenes TaxID=2655001 RepID=A0A6A7K5I0_9FIRM|nr:energy-coupled thiamine transporter ThiT [Alkalibaculum sporogenes]MPW24604.1 energy-coupled thiamine transporter ThiT [Alkalibaculum sporogenes]